MSEYLTTQQAADFLGYHVNHVYRLLSQGVIHGKQFSKVWMIPRSEVERIKALQEDGRLPRGTIKPE